MTLTNIPPPTAEIYIFEYYNQCEGRFDKNGSEIL